jgi:tetratricopeptide (TPR) repeat protein
LYTRLLDALREFHKSKGPEAETGKSMAYHLILLAKGHTQQAKKELAKAKKVALKYERFDELIKLMQMETRLLREETDLDTLDKHLTRHREQLATSLHILDKELQYEQEYLNMVKWNKEIEFARTEKELSALSAIVSKPIFKSDPKTISVKSRIYYHYIKGLYHFFKGSFTSSIPHFEQQLELFKKYPHWVEDQPMMYIRCIGNYSLLNIKLGNEHGCKIGLSQLENITDIHPSTQQYTEYLIYMLKLMRLVKSGRHKEATDYIDANPEPVTLGTAPFKEWYLEWVYACFNAVAAYMSTGNYPMALRYLNNFLNTADPNLKQDVYCIGRVLNLLIHFELDNRDLLEYILESTHRYLKGKKRLFGFEKAILSFIKMSIDTDLQSDQNELFNQLRLKLIPLKKDPFEKNVFEYFDFIGWIERSIITRQ